MSQTSLRSAFLQPDEPFILASTFSLSFFISMSIIRQTIPNPISQRLKTKQAYNKYPTLSATYHTSWESIIACDVRLEVEITFKSYCSPNTYKFTSLLDQIYNTILDVLIILLTATIKYFLHQSTSNCWQFQSKHVLYLLSFPQFLKCCFNLWYEWPWNIF